MSELRIKRNFKGPSHWNQTRGEYVPYTKPELLAATMEWNGKLYELSYGNLRVSVNTKSPHTVFVYFQFEYLKDGIRESGRWYNTEFPVSALKEITNSILTYTMTDFIDHGTSETPVVCTTRITLRPNWADWLKTIGETRPSPPTPSHLDTLMDYWDSLYDFCTRPLCNVSYRCRRSRNNR